MRSITLKSTGTNWCIHPGAEREYRQLDVLVVRDVPDDVGDEQVLRIANLTIINTPARPSRAPTVSFSSLGEGRFVNLWPEYAQ